MPSRRKSPETKSPTRRSDVGALRSRPAPRHEPTVALLRQTQPRNAGVAMFDLGRFVRRFPPPLRSGGRRP